MSVFSVQRIENPRPNLPPRELLTLEDPVVGRPMSLYRGDNGRRLCTTAVVRVLALTDGAMFVQTRNSTYRLESLASMPFKLPRAGNGW